MPLFYNVTPSIRSLCERVRAAGALNNADEPDVRAALDADSDALLPVQTLLRVHAADDAVSRMPLVTLLRGATLQAERREPPKRSAEFAAHMERLRHAQERRAYERMVGAKEEGVAGGRPAADGSNALRDTSAQLNLALNMLVSAVTVFIAVFWYARQSYGTESHIAWIAGLVGAIGILIAETVLLIIRTGAADSKVEASVRATRARQERGVRGKFALSSRQIAELLATERPDSDQLD